MTEYDDIQKKPKRVSEPVQVYLSSDDLQRLEWLTSELGATKSDVLRRGLEALERQHADPTRHPALGILALGDSAMAPAPTYDVAREHDRFLAESEEASWQPTSARARGR